MTESTFLASDSHGSPEPTRVGRVLNVEWSKYGRFCFLTLIQFVPILKQRDVKLLVLVHFIFCVHPLSYEKRNHLRMFHQYFNPHL